MQACGPNEPNYRCESTISVALSLFATVQKYEVKTQWLDMQTKKKKKKLHGIQILIYNVNINEL